LNDLDAAKFDKYTCPSCKIIIREGKKPPTSLKEKNLNKEQRSSCHQTAIKAVGLLVELVGTICPLIDQIGSTSKSRYSSEKYRDAIVYLTNSLQEAQKARDRGSNANADDGFETVERFGTLNLLEVWLQSLTNYYRQFSSWSAQFNQYFETEMSSVYQSPSINFNELTLVSTSLENLKKLEELLPPSPPNDVEGYLLFVDSLKWIHDLLEVHIY